MYARTSSAQVVAYLVLLVLEVHRRTVLLLHLAAVELVEVVLEVAQDFAQFLLLVAHARLLVEQLRSANDKTNTGHSETADRGYMDMCANA